LIEKIDVNLKTIRNLFDRVLDISRIDSGNVTPSMRPVRLQTLFDKFDAQFGELAASKGLWLRFVPTEAYVEHDIELLDRMVSNLVHNAIKYTPMGGVWVAWRSARGRLEVRDSGLGISPRNQHIIFDEFAQLNNAARNNEAGLGLGLSIVKRLADLTSTRLGVNSKLRQGSTFWLGLQTTYVADNVMVVANSYEGFVKPVLTGMRILYAEDEPQIRALFTDMLQDAGAVVHACSDVDHAKIILNSDEPIDIILTDYRLGDSGTGLDLVHAARARKSFENDSKITTLPAILLTGDTAVKDLLSIQQLPNCTLMHKPIDFDDLAHELIARNLYIKA
jgi:two-component system, sensor histidine kinase